MRTGIVGWVLLIGVVCVPQQSRAQAEIIELVKNATKKIIQAIDLKIQRLQNKTIWLQNAQQTVEQLLTKAKLAEIGGWVDKQKTLYADYFDELKKVKLAISTYHRVKEIIETQGRIVRDYHAAIALFKNDKHFTPDELQYIGQVYAGILEQSVKNMAQVELVLTALVTQMNDAQRLDVIYAAARQVDDTYSDLQAFTNQNKVLSLQRSATEQEVIQLKALYGIE